MKEFQHMCGRCDKPIRLVRAEALPAQTAELYGLQALVKIGEMCFGLFPMSYDDENDYRIHHCTLDMYFRNFGTDKIVSK